MEEIRIVDDNDIRSERLKVRRKIVVWMIVCGCYVEMEGRFVCLPLHTVVAFGPGTTRLLKGNR